ncbi:MAG: hypothetical protein ACKODT_02365 [Fluviibacter sp.]
MTTPYVRLLNTLRSARSSTDGDLNHSHEELLAFIAEHTNNGSQLKITDLIYQKDFGTGQTISNKVAYLVSNGFLEQIPNEVDKRIKTIRLTKKANNFFDIRSKSMCKLCT